MSGKRITKAREGVERTKEIFAADPNAIIYEAAALHGRYQARIDILRRQGDTLAK